MLLSLLLVMPYCLFRFAALVPHAEHAPCVRWPSRSRSASWHSPSRCNTSRTRGVPAPAELPRLPRLLPWPFTFLFAYVVIRFLMAGRGEPPIAATRMRLLAVAVAGLQVQVVVAAL